LAFLLDSRARQDDCAQAACDAYLRLRDRGAARGVWRWLLRQSRQQGRFAQLGAAPLCSVLKMAAAEGDVGQLRHFAAQLSGPWPHSAAADVAKHAGMDVLKACIFAPEPAAARALQRLLPELAGRGGSSSGRGSSSSSNINSSSPGWELLLLQARDALPGAACAAAKHGKQAALQLIIQSGRPITMRLINTAARASDLRLLMWLLSAGPLPAPGVHGLHLYLGSMYCISNRRRIRWYQGCPLWHAIRQVSGACCIMQGWIAKAAPLSGG
jgi:hypothetical protein